MVKPGLNRDRFLLEWGCTEFKRNVIERLINRQLLRETEGGPPRSAAPECQRSPVPAVCSAHLVTGRVAAETSGSTSLAGVEVPSLLWTLGGGVWAPG